MLCKTGADPVQTGIDLSWGVLAAGIVQLLIVYGGVRQPEHHRDFRSGRA